MRHIYPIIAAAAVALAAGCTNEEENEYYPAAPGSLTLRVSTTNVLLPATDASAEVSVESNSRWTVSDTGDNSWITITYTSEPAGTANGTFTITAANNLTQSTRTTTLLVTSAEKSERITVTQSATSLAVDPSVFATFPAEGGTETLHVLSSTRWTVTTVADWISLTPAGGEASDEIADVTVTVAPTTLETTRTSQIEVSCPDDPSIEPFTVTVSQRGRDPEQTWFEVNPTVLPQFVYGKSTATVNVRSSAPWTIRSVASWLSFSPASGDGGEDIVEVSVVAAVNPDEIERTAEIIVESTDRTFEPVKIPVTQEAAPAAPKFFEVSPTAVPEIGYGGDSFNITVRSSSAYKVSTIADWIELEVPGTQAATESPFTFGVSVKANPDEVAREAVITLESENTAFQPVSISVRQQARPATPRYFQISPETLPEISAAGGTATVSVRSSAPWTVATAATWLSLSTTSGNGGDENETLTITIPANQYAAALEATLTFTSSDHLVSQQNLTLTLRQAGAAAPSLGEATVSNIAINSAAVSCPLTVPSPGRLTEKGVMYRAAGSDASWTTVADESAAADRVAVTLTDLRPGTRYEAKAYCRATSGNAETATVTFRTEGTTPGIGDNTPPTRR